jgi:hypothetical protein
MSCSRQHRSYALARIDAEIVTSEHREIGRCALQCGCHRTITTCRPWHAAQYASNESFPTRESPRNAGAGGLVCALVITVANIANTGTANMHIRVRVRISTSACDYLRERQPSCRFGVVRFPWITRGWLRRHGSCCGKTRDEHRQLRNLSLVDSGQEPGHAQKGRFGVARDLLPEPALVFQETARWLPQ